MRGYVLQNVLLLRDIDAAERRFRDLLVFADSGLLFAALGLRGAANEIAAKELFSLLRETGAHLNVFEPTIREMRRVLAVYEELLGTPAGRLSLHPTDITRHLLSQRATPSDVRMIASLLETNIKGLGVMIRELPQREPKWTMDERLLGRMLTAPEGKDDEPRVIHDVDCIAGVLMYRRGRTDASIDRAVAVFATTSGLTVRNTRLWYEAEGGRGFPPIVHHRALSNYAWLKKPASAAQLKVHELVALCAAALRPSRKAWSTFVSHLKTLEESGELSSDEVTAIIANDLTERILVEVDPSEDSDAASLSEVVERVTASYKRSSDERERVAYAAAEQSEADATRLRDKAMSNSRSVAKVFSWVIAGLLTVSLIAGTLITVGMAASGETPSLVALMLALIPLAAVGLFGMLWGFHVIGWRRRVEDVLFRLLVEWMTGETK